MWTPDHSYWPQKKNSSYYPALSEIPFPSWKITEKIQFFPKKQPFSIKEKEAQNGLDSMRSFFFGVTPSSHEKWSNPYRKWRLSGRSIFNFLVQKQLFFMDFHSNSLKCFIFFNDFSYKFTSLVRKTPDATKISIYTLSKLIKIHRFIFDFLLQKWPKNCIFINKNNWKLVLIITFRSRRIAKFCKKRWPQLILLFTLRNKSTQNSMKKHDFRPPTKFRGARAASNY